MKTSISLTPLAIGLLILTFLAGWYVHDYFQRKGPVKTQIEWFERLVVIPPKTETKPGRPVQPNLESARRDTILITAPCDSLRAWARDHAQSFTTTFEDTIFVKDSLGSFYARQLTTIEVDPWTRIIIKAHEFKDAVFKLARVQTTQTVYENDFLLSAVIFLVGIVIGGILVLIAT